MMKKILILSGLLLMNFTMEAQFLKKLKKKVEQKVEDVVTNKVTDKAASETEKSMENILNPGNNENSESRSKIAFMSSDPVDPSKIRDEYKFDWKYTLEFESKDESEHSAITYLLTEDRSYYAMDTENGKMYFIWDFKNEVNLMLMDNGEKFMSSSNMKNSEKVQEIENKLEELEVNEIAGKSILGYKCDGYKVENEEYVYKIYVTEEAPVDFGKMYDQKKFNFLQSFNPRWLNEDGGLMMEMQFENKQSSKGSGKIICTGLDKETRVINPSKYQKGNIH